LYKEYKQISHFQYFDITHGISSVYCHPERSTASPYCHPERSTAKSKGLITLTQKILHSASLHSE